MEMISLIKTLYKPFQHWSDGGSVYIISDTHFGDSDCKLMDPDWITPEKHIEIINKIVFKGDTLVHLGDVGDPKYISQIKARKKILILGNHDTPGKYRDLFYEIYTGPVFISNKILLSHEPIEGLPWCLNIHGHDHGGKCWADKTHINLASNVCKFIPKNLDEIIRNGAVSNIKSIHRMTIDEARSK